MLEKALSFSPDAYIPDMEDSVPPAEKNNARQTVAEFLPKLGAAGPLVVPRVNAWDTGLMDDDLEAAISPNTYGISVGKINDAQDIHRISATMDQLEDTAGIPGTTRLIPWIETASAVVHAYEICTASPRVAAVAFGAEDFTNDMGIERTEDDREVAYARSAVCVAAKAAGVLAIDTPYFKYRDAEGLRRDARAARGYGFRGKCAIYPDQVDVINEAFSPTRSEVENALHVVAAFEEAERNGRGSTSLDGKVVDVPVVKRAHGLLALARETGRDIPNEV